MSTHFGFSCNYWFAAQRIADHDVAIARHAAANTQRGNRRQRLAEIAAHGQAMLTTPDTAAANAWLRRYVRIYIEHNSIIEVRFL